MEEILSENLMKTISFYDYQKMDQMCEEALRQIEENQYEAQLRTEGHQQITKYGVTFYCKVKKRILEI